MSQSVSLNVTRSKPGKFQARNLRSTSCAKSSASPVEISAEAGAPDKGASPSSPSAIASTCSSWLYRSSARRTRSRVSRVVRITSVSSRAWGLRFAASVEAKSDTAPSSVAFSEMRRPDSSESSPRVVSKSDINDRIRAASEADASTTELGSARLERCVSSWCSGAAPQTGHRSTPSSSRRCPASATASRRCRSETYCARRSPNRSDSARRTSTRESIVRSRIQASRRRDSTSLTDDPNEANRDSASAYALSRRPS